MFMFSGANVLHTHKMVYLVFSDLFQCLAKSRHEARGHPNKYEYIHPNNAWPSPIPNNVEFNVNSFENKRDNGLKIFGHKDEVNLVASVHLRSFLAQLSMTFKCQVKLTGFWDPLQHL